MTTLIPGPRPSGLDLVPRTDTVPDRRAFVSDQEVRWCPGCGDYAVLAAVQSFLPSLGVPRENIVIVSGIGCAARMPYYVNTYGIHSIHGRAPAIATGLAVTRPDLSIWVVGGDGDLLSIGANHLLHALRRNVNIKILLLNNRIYGLTKGQYSPTSEAGKRTKSSPSGSPDYPLNPVSLALGADATFVARTLDSDRGHLTGVLSAAATHRGAAFVEILQNCDIYNDGAFAALKDPQTRDEAVVRLEAGQPIRFGAGGGKGVRVGADGRLEVVDVDGTDPAALLVHDPGAPGPELAFLLSRLGNVDSGVTPIGVLRDVDRPAYDDEVRRQLPGSGAATPADLQRLLTGTETWDVG